MASFSFPKSEKLKHKRLFSLLFEKGKSKYRFPLRMLWIKVDPPISDIPFLCGVTVPKKSFSKAVQRNKIKRQLREAYRLNKLNIWKQHHDDQYAILFIYSAKEFVPFDKIMSTMDILTKFLHNQISQK